MKPDHGPSAEGSASFYTTRWTVVMRAAQNQTLGAQSALAELCRTYWYPLYMFARRRGHPPEDAQDLTQGFFLHVLERQALTGAHNQSTIATEIATAAIRPFVPSSSRTRRKSRRAAF